MTVCYRTHNGAYRETVKVVIDKNKYAQNKSSKLCADTGFYMSFSPTAEGGASAGLVNEGNNYTQNNKEQEDTCGIGNGGDQTVTDYMVYRLCSGTVAGQNTSDNDA